MPWSSWLFLLFHVVVLPFAVLHALLYKRDHRTALGWIGIIIVFPVAGSLLYFLFGINRIHSRARLFARGRIPLLDWIPHLGYERMVRLPASRFATVPDAEPLSQVGFRVTGVSLLPGNQIEMLRNGEGFFPRLLQEIAAARHSVVISSYLFSTHGIAGAVIDALVRAHVRGVAVHVLVDGVGAWYSWRSAVRRLQQQGVRVATFLPPRLFPLAVSINLRNHRKIAVMDGVVGFFGGMNIDQRHMLTDPDNRHATEDLHFAVRGPVVQRLQEVFAHDWWMVTHTSLDVPSPTGAGVGEVACRIIDDGPDESLDYLGMTLQGVFSAAQHEILIMMPYFLPSREMLSVLQAASLRGVRVRILLPARSNLRFVDWATRNMLWELVMWHVEVYVRPPPFAHTKLITVDDHYVLGGSANLDPRSLRLNFELGVEMFDTHLARSVRQHIEGSLERSHRLTLEELDRRPRWQRIRDAFFWLFSGYL